jgi:hypothetical protein
MYETQVDIDSDNRARTEQNYVTWARLQYVRRQQKLALSYMQAISGGCQELQTSDKWWGGPIFIGKSDGQHVINRGKGEAVDLDAPSRPDRIHYNGML